MKCFGNLFLIGFCCLILYSIEPIALYVVLSVGTLFFLVDYFYKKSLEKEQQIEEVEDSFLDGNIEEFKELRDKAQEEKDSNNYSVEEYTKALQDSKVPIYVNETQFEDIKGTLVRALKYLDKISHKDSFQKHFNSLQNNLDIPFTIKAIFTKDILRCYDEIGLKSDMNLNKPEGQYLYVISRLVSSDDADTELDYESFCRDIKLHKSITQKIHELSKQQLAVFKDMKIHIAYPGLDIFKTSIILATYDDNYEVKFRPFINHIAQIIVKADGIVSEKEQQWLNRIQQNEKVLDEEYKKQNLESGITPLEEDEEENGTTKEILTPSEKLNHLVGLDFVKKEIHNLSDFIKISQQREKNGMKAHPISYHCVFTGNPGTGKTTVARILADIFKELGVLSKGQLIETDRSGLVAEYVGQTAVKTNKIIDSALDGVLFLDEAYTLAQGGNNDYGKEAIATLLKRMEDDRQRLIVILAGYTQEIENFINTNPGLRSRFNRFIHFEDYNANELYEIFLRLLKENDYVIEENAKETILNHFLKITKDNQKDFGNARYVRNLFEKTIETQAARLASEPKLTKELLWEIKSEDLYFLNN